MLTKYTTTLEFRRCNLCDSIKITWSDDDDVNHLCKEHCK